MKRFCQIIVAAFGMILLGAQPALAAENVCDGQMDSTNEYENRPIGSSSEYIVQLNYWNSIMNAPACTNCPSTGNLCLDIDTGTGAFTMTTAPGSVPTNAGPAGYPSIIKGCQWGTLCTNTSSSNMPLQVKEITGLPSTWNITTADGVWDAAYDIWFNTTPSSGSLGQNDGLEIMVWINNSGYLDGTATSIQPSGEVRFSNEAIPGVQGTWDVWTARLHGAADWNVVSFVKVDKITDYNFDGKRFIDYMRTKSGLKCPASPSDQTNPTAACINDAWYLTSVQAGFEPWINGKGLASNTFKAAVTKTGTVSQDGRTGDDGTPIVYWGSPFDIVTPSCSGSGTAKYTITDGSGTVMSDGTGKALKDVPMTLRSSDKMFVATVPPLNPNTHGLMTITITKSCGTESFGVYVDPSGNVQSLDGQPVPGATVTLLRWASATGTFDPVVSGSTILAPYTATNPQISDVQGHFGWDVDLTQPGFYKVRAEKAECVAPVESGVYAVPPPVTGIILKLDCPSSPGPNFPASVSKYTDWNTGYCANITVTNNTSKPAIWKTTVPFPGGTIYTAWNFNYTLSGNQMTIWGVDWNKTLEAGASTHSIGFCANR